MSPDRSQRGAEQPDPERDYRETTLPEVLALAPRGGLLLIDPTRFCNLRCTFCDLPITSRRAIELDGIRTIVKALGIAGIRDAVISGGEPSLYPRLAELMGLLRSAGMSTTMLTHGLWAANEGSLMRVLRMRPNHVLMSLKGFDRASHEILTGRPGRGHDTQMKALARLVAVWESGELEDLRINHVITRHTLGSLASGQWLDGIERLPPVVLSMVEAYRDDMVDLVPTPGEIAELLPRALDAITAKGGRVEVEGVPLCLLGDWHEVSRAPARASDQRTRILMIPSAGDDLALIYRGYQRTLQFAQRDGCAGCSLVTQCAGIHKRLGSDWSAALFAEIPAPR